MARYTLDYSVPVPARRRTRSRPGRWPLVVALLSLCFGLIAFIYAYHVRAENLHLRQQRDALLLRYDSLQAAQGSARLGSTGRQQKSNPLLIKP